jgi:hypothetical protein
MKAMIMRLVRAIQKILITVLLFFVYIFGFGLTLVWAMIFKRELLGRGIKMSSSFWRKADGYEAHFEDAMRQS